MRLNFNIALATQYKSQSQAIRVMTENWVKNEIFWRIFTVKIAVKNMS